ncbi:MFS transporter [Microlunatus ginsengisoli]|uniref:MFS transporter n=1 Tax=Microlunatus ginsengisoli TaxID=363863 RepID=A0ABP7A7M7_9ACTN
MTDTHLAGTAGTAAPDSRPYRWRWAVLAVILAAEIMDLLDSTIVNLAATPIARDLGGGASTVQWVVGAYTLAFAVALVIGGRLGDKFGRKNLFVLGAAGFTVASLICATAQEPTVLIVARAVQGLLGAVLIPQGFGIMKQVFPPQDLGKAFASFGPVIGLSAIAGPLLGGVLVDADLFGLGWRIIFLINVPIGIATVIAAVVLIPRSDRRPELRFDPLGLVLFAAAALLLIYPLIEGHELGWPWWTYASMAVALILFGVFAWHERHSAAPLIEPTLLTNRSYVGGLGLILLGFAAMIGFSLVFNVYAQAALGYSPLTTAFAGCAYAVGMALAAGLGSAALVPRFGRRVLVLGYAVMALGALGMVATVRLTGLTAHPWQFLPAGFVFGVGGGLAIVPVFSVILAGVQDHEVGSASGLLNAVQQLGGTIGVAVSGTLFFQLLPSRGPVDAMQITTLVAAAFLIGCLGLVRLLPRRARPE